MLNGKKLVVVMPAYNAEKTLEKTYSELPLDIVDEVILVDDHSHDRTSQISDKLGIHTHVHSVNKGYGGNQKSCYTEALDQGADIVIMVHPDYQYTPKLVGAMAWLIAHDVYDVVLGSRILGDTALSGGMPLYKYMANRALTFAQNLLMQQKLSEYHTGLRAFSRQVLETLPLEENQDDFIFDNEMLTQAFFFDFRFGEVSCPTRYFDEASSINFKRSVEYGVGCLINSVYYVSAKQGWYTPSFLKKNGKTLSKASKE